MSTQENEGIDPVKQVRLLIADANEFDPYLSAEQVEGFLAINAGSVRRAAADALDAIASSETLVDKVIKTQDLTVDGTKVADSLRRHADRLRVQARDEEADQDSWDGFAVVDTITPAGRRRTPELTPWVTGL